MKQQQSNTTVEEKQSSNPMLYLIIQFYSYLRAIVWIYNNRGEPTIEFAF